MRIHLKFFDYFDKNKCYNKIVLDQSELDKAKFFCENNLVAIKSTEEHNKKDNISIYKRYYNGILSELAIEKFLNITFINWNIIGKSQNFYKPDLKEIGLNVGIKSCEYGSFPLININSKDPEIILLKENDNTFILLGFASNKILKENLNSDLTYGTVDSSKKSSFFGFKLLKEFNSLEELKYLVSKFK